MNNQPQPQYKTRTGNNQLVLILNSEISLPIEETQAEIQAAEAQLAEAEDAHAALIVSNKELKQEYNKLLTWADLYDQSTFEAKKMIAAQLIKSVHVGRDYNIEIVFNISFQEFQEAKLSGENHTKTPPCSHPA